MAVATEHGLFIDGEVVEPASGEVRDVCASRRRASCSPARRWAARPTSTARSPLRAPRSTAPGARRPGTERSRLLHALADAIAANRKELAELESRNVGKAISSVKAEIAGAAENFRFYASAIATIAGPLESDRRLAALLLAEGAGRRRGADRAVELPAADGDVEARARARRRLRGRAQAGPADAADACCASPSSRPRSASRPGAINIVPGDGPTTGAYLVKHPGVDKVAFTGSTRTGGEIMRLCSDPIKRLTLELGGKSPNLLFADADLADAIPASVWAIYASAGQSCEARSRLLVEQSIYDDVVAQVTELAQRVKVGDPLERETQMGSLISTAHREKVHGFVEGAREEGAEVTTGGAIGDGPGAFYPPTVIARRRQRRCARRRRRSSAPS